MFAFLQKEKKPNKPTPESVVKSTRKKTPIWPIKCYKVFQASYYYVFLLSVIYPSAQCLDFYKQYHRLYFGFLNTKPIYCPFNCHVTPVRFKNVYIVHRAKKLTRFSPEAQAFRETQTGKMNFKILSETLHSKEKVQQIYPSCDINEEESTTEEFEPASHKSYKTPSYHLSFHKCSYLLRTMKCHSK